MEYCSLKLINSDIQTSCAKYICITCNCCSDENGYIKEPSLNTFVKKFTYADIYRYRKTPSRLGTYLIVGGSGEKLITILFSRKRSGRPSGPDDSGPDRLRWFKEALMGFAKIPNLESVAFQYGTGFIDTGGNLNDYIQAISDFAHTANLYAYQNGEHVDVFLYGDKSAIDNDFSRERSGGLVVYRDVIEVELIQNAHEPNIPCQSEPSQRSTSGIFSDLEATSWSTIFNDPSLTKNIEFVNTSISHLNFDDGTVQPQRRQLFTAFKLCSWSKMRVVFIGQDPYPTAGNANGMSFSVNHGVRIPYALGRIFNAIVHDPKVKFEMPEHGSLESWAKQGVLMFNCALTVETGKPASHMHIWSNFGKTLIQLISNKSRRRLIFVLWGNFAKDLSIFIDETKHNILKFSHPAAERYGQDFSKCAHFSLINDELIRQGDHPINWQI